MAPAVFAPFKRLCNSSEMGNDDDDDDDGGGGGDLKAG